MKEPEVPGHDSNDRVVFSIQPDLLADDLGIRVELMSPEAVAHDHHFALPTLVLLLHEATALCGWRTKHCKKAGTDGKRGDDKRPVATGKIECRTTVDCEVVERGLLGSPFSERGRIDNTLVEVSPAFARERRDERFGVRKRQRSQENLI